MSEDKQLTVAELLARAEKSAPGEAQARPRRRRSLEEGGVSVAELTGSIKKVEAQPAESKHSNVPIDAPAAPKPEVPKPEVRKPEVRKPDVVKPAAPLSDDTAVIRKVEQGKRPTGSTQGSTKVAATAETGVIPVVPGEKDVQRDGREVGKVDEFGDLNRADARNTDPLNPDAAPAAEVEDNSLNPIVLVVLVFLGLVLGILGFLAFQWVWANTSTTVSVVLAVVAVAAIVFGVRALRTGRDGMTMALAGAASAVMAFGPALIV